MAGRDDCQVGSGGGDAGQGTAAVQHQELCREGPWWIPGHLLYLRVGLEAWDGWKNTVMGCKSEAHRKKDYETPI